MKLQTMVCDVQIFSYIASALQGTRRSEVMLLPNIVAGLGVVNNDLREFKFDDGSLNETFSNVQYNL